MRFKRVAILLIVIALLGTGSVFADTLYSEYTARKFSVTVNEKELIKPGLAVNFGKESRAMVPLNEIANQLGGIVKWNDASDVAEIQKPNVNLTMLRAKDQKAFGLISKGRYDIHVFAQVDSLKTPIQSFKINVVDPNGTEIESVTVAVNDHKENFWYQTDVLKLNIRHYGNYSINFLIEDPGSKEFVQVGQLVVNSAN